MCNLKISQLQVFKVFSYKWGRNNFQTDIQTIYIHLAEGQQMLQRIICLCQ